MQIEINQYKAQMEAVLFASGEPFPIARLAEVLEVTEETVLQVATLLKDDYDRAERGMMLLFLEDSLQLSTKDVYADVVRAALEVRRNAPLSQAAMEVLSIIAYNQPVTKSFVEQVRGVESGQIVNNLAEKGLVEEAGRLDVPGRPIAYRTTLHFLRCFGIESLEQLPPLPDQSGQVMLDEYIAGERGAAQAEGGVGESPAASEDDQSGGSVSSADPGGQAE
ncbi:MAG: SMC-Scp complex subunit ScpB [Oscillospiraceae bacterium]|jgi:segregation and condensation protein B